MRRFSRSRSAQSSSARGRCDNARPVSAVWLVRVRAAPTRPARDALRGLSIKQLRAVLAAHGVPEPTSAKEKDDLVNEIIAHVLSD